MTNKKVSALLNSLEGYAKEYVTDLIMGRGDFQEVARLLDLETEYENYKASFQKKVKQKLHLEAAKSIEKFRKFLLSKIAEDPEKFNEIWKK